MLKYSNKKTNDPPTSNGCFTTIFQRLLCTSNLPTHSCSSDQMLEKPGKIHPIPHSLSDLIASDIVVKSQVQGNGPGVIAKLMGLESLPKCDKITSDMLFRSKSLNSLQFLPDFNPTRSAFHRRARTSASFHEQGHKVLGRIDEDLVDNGMKMSDFEEGFGCMKQRKKEVVLKGENECKKSRQKSGGIKESWSQKKYDECYYTSNSKLKKNLSGNGVINKSNYVKEKCGMPKRKLLVDKEKINNRKFVGSKKLTSKKKVDHKHDMCVEVTQSDDLLPSKSPISVLDHCKESPPTSKGERRQNTSKLSRRKSSPKIKINDNLPKEIVPKSKQNSRKMDSKHKVMKAEEVADNFVEMLANISKLPEDQTEDSYWVANYDLVKAQFVKEFSMALGQELLDLLLDELIM